MDSNQESNSPQPSQRRSLRCFSSLSDALAYAESKSREATPIEPNEQAPFVEYLPGIAVMSLGRQSPVYSASAELHKSPTVISPGRSASLDLDLVSGSTPQMESQQLSRTRSRKCLSRLSDALEYAESDSERAASAEQSSEPAAFVELLPEIAESLQSSLRQRSPVYPASAELLSHRLSTGMSPGRSSSLDLVSGPTPTPPMDLKLSQSVPFDLLSERDKSPRFSTGEADCTYPSTGNASLLHRSPGQDAAFEMSPETSASFHPSPERDVSLEMSFEQSSLPPLTPGRNASFNLSPTEQARSFDQSGQAEPLYMSPRRSASLQISPERASSSVVPPGKVESETFTRRRMSYNTLPEDGPHHNRSVSRSSLEAAKIHIPTTQRLDLVSRRDSAIGNTEPTWNISVNRVQDSPFAFGPMPLPSIKGSLREEKFNAEMKKTEEERRSRPMEKENDLKELKAILFLQNETIAKRRVTGNDLQILSKLRNKQLLTENKPLVKKDKTKVFVSKKTKTKPALVPQKDPKSPKPEFIVRETKASKLRKTAQIIYPPVITRKAKPVKSPTKPPAPARHIATQLVPRRSLSPAHISGSFSESPPPTPSENCPPRPDFVPKLDLSFVLSPEDYPSGNPIPPPVFAVRETKTSKLRRLKKEEEEKKMNPQGKNDRSKTVEWEHSLETLQRTRTPIMRAFKPSPPKTYTKPAPVVVRETKASKLRKLAESKKSDPK